MEDIGLIKHILSYLWDFKIERITSEKNGLLEVTYQYGRYILNSENANYSFELLHRVFQKGLSKIDDYFHPNTILNLGMGAGSTLKILREEKGWQGSIVSVEHDPEIVRLADKYFNINSYSDHRIELVDAMRYLENSEESFDLIVIDLFRDRRVPEKFTSIDFYQLVSRHLNQNGKVVANFISDEVKMDLNIRNLITQLETIYSRVQMYSINGINRFLIIDK